MCGKNDLKNLFHGVYPSLYWQIIELFHTFVSLMYMENVFHYSFPLLFM